MAFGPVSDFRTAMGEIFLLTYRSVMTCQRRWAWGHKYGGLEDSFQSASFEVTTHKHPPKCLGHFNLPFLVEENKTHMHTCTPPHNLTKQKLPKASSITAFTAFLTLYHSDGSYKHEYQLRHRIR